FLPKLVTSFVGQIVGLTSDECLKSKVRVEIA
ncbi:hypothetical protein MGSAQ_001259, partial [marine sediment metagenome]